MSGNWIIASQKYIGKKWHASGFECYDFVRALYHDVTGHELPIIAGMHSKAKSKQYELMFDEFPNAWTETETPVPGTLVTLSRGAIPMHVGIYVGQGFIAHVFNAADGVMLHKKINLDASGWNICGYINYKS